MLLSVSIDLDPLRCYREIFGLPPAAERLDPAVLTGSARFCDLMDSLGHKGTLFVVGDSTKEPEVQARLRAASEQGFELSNHTWSHPYDLSRLSTTEMDDEIGRGQDAVAQICGRAPTGFRAPGYLLGPRLLGRLETFGLAYDSSILPSPFYQAAKLAARGILRLLGRSSGAISGDPREALGPGGPYRPDPARPWRRGASGLVELPISAAGPLPLTGSVLALAGKRGGGLFSRLVARRPFVNLELHGVDLLDLRTDGLDPALGAQPDLRLRWEDKAEKFRRFILDVSRSRRVVTLAEAAVLEDHRSGS